VRPSGDISAPRKRTTGSFSANAVFLTRTRTGLNLRSVGENPATADAAGINVTRYKYLAAVIGCAICGLGGLFYVMDYIQGTWANDSAIEALGWLAVALVIFTSWKPISAIWGSFVFGLCYWVYLYIPAGISQVLAKALGTANPSHMQNLYRMIPYLVTIVILILVSKRKRRENQNPQSLGISYFREER
jgi:simple sugar transport system permease protein